MRKLNVFLAIGMLVSFILHAVFAGLRLAGAESGTMTVMAHICIGFITAHVAVSMILTVKTLYSLKKSKAGYFKNNLLFWARRISGLTIPIPLVMHLKIFIPENADVFRLNEFNTGRLISQILLLASIGLHVIINIKPLLLALGVKGHKSAAADIIFILSVLLFLFAAAFAIYYIRWISD